MLCVKSNDGNSTWYKLMLHTILEPYHNTHYGNANFLLQSVINYSSKLGRTNVLLVWTFRRLDHCALQYIYILGIINLICIFAFRTLNLTLTYSPLSLFRWTVYPVQTVSSLLCPVVERSAKKMDDSQDFIKVWLKSR